MAAYQRAAYNETLRQTANQGDAGMFSGMLPALQSSALFGDTSVRAIEHRGEYYFLRLTRSGKLILSK